MKRILAAVLVAAMLLLLFGCDRTPTEPVTAVESTSGTKESNPTTPTPTSTTTVSEATSTTKKTTTTGPTKPTEAGLPAEEARIPVIHIDVVGGADVTSNEEYVQATFSMEGRQSGFNSVETVGCQIRGRGHSSWLWDKKPYKIKLDTAMPLCGMSEGKQWVLLANHADKSLSRNFVATSMAATLSGLDYTVRQQHVELYLNGKYIGVYTLSEQIQVKENRVNLTVSDAADTGYLLEIGGRDSGSDHDTINHDYFMAGFSRHIRIKAPDTSTEITQAQINYIIKYVNDVNDAIAAHDGYEELIDVDSFIDWGILHEITYNMDSCYRRSCFMTKDAGGKLKMGPVWDFDLGLGNYGKDPKDYPDLVTIGPGTEDLLDYEQLKDMDHKTYSYDDYYVILTWMNYLLSDPPFYERYVARWNEVKDTLLATGLAAIDRSGYLLDGAEQRNFARWDVMGGKAGYCSSATAKITTFDGQLDYLRNFLKKRYNFLDKRLNG